MLGDKSKVRICGCSHEVARHKLVDVGGGVMKHAGACEHGCGCAGLHKRRRGTSKLLEGVPAGLPLSPGCCSGFFQGGAFVHTETCEREQPRMEIVRLVRACNELRDALVMALTTEAPNEALGQQLVEALAPRPVGVGLFGPSAVLNRERKPAASPALTADTGLPKGELAILTACAQHDGGCTRTQLTALTGYKKATRNAYVARLLDRSLVAEVDDGNICATKNGLDLLGPKFKKLPTGDELRALLLESLPEGESLILDVVCRAYPLCVTRDQITTSTGYKKATRNAYIARLAAKLLVDASHGDVVASKHLFGGKKRRAK